MIDTNVYVAGTISPNSPPARILSACITQHIVPLMNRTQIAELGRVLHKKSIQHYLGFSDTQITHFVQRWVALSEVIEDRSYPDAAMDVPDNAILGCAVDGHADLIITGDTKHLLPLAEYQGIPILSPRQFIETFLARR